MCFSFEVSLTTFASSWLISFYLLTKKLTVYQRQRIIFLLIFSSMQLTDAILWFVDMKKNNINYYITSIAIPIILSLQILYNVLVINKCTNIYIIILAVLLCLYMFKRFNGYSKNLCKNKFASPVWGSKELKLWELMIFMIFIFYPYLQSVVIALFILIPIIHVVAGGAYGSLWCTVSNAIAFYYLYTYS